MIVLLSCAKTMSFTSKVKAPLQTDPLFKREASEIALQMLRFSVSDLERLLRVNTKIAIENYMRFREFHSDSVPELQALLAYTGIVFKRLDPQRFTAEDFLYAQNHLRLTSFCYGLLRPMDMIRPYRLEGNVRLPEFDHQTLFAYWKSRLTDIFIHEIKAGGGVLCNLASDEMKDLFDWPRLAKEVRVVTPEFRVWKKDKPTTVVIYTKMCRGEMTRLILKERIEEPDDLAAFSWEGFVYDERLSKPGHPMFVNG
jgi:cytoplasmic iron level regulating protein YaaA (DUF328/UPF0246 family)